MKKIFSLLLVGVLLGGNVALGSEGELSGVFPIKYILEAKPGETLHLEIEFKNNKKNIDTAYFTTGLGTFGSRGQSGTPFFTHESEIGNLEDQITNWITLETDNFSLKYGETKKILFSIKIPDKTKQGGYYGAIFIEDKNQLVNVSYASLILLDIIGKENQKTGNIENINSSRKGDVITIETDIKNNGNSHFIPSGEISLLHKNNTPMASKYKNIKINPNGGSVLPGSIRSFHTAIDIGDIIRDKPYTIILGDIKVNIAGNEYTKQIKIYEKNYYNKNPSLYKKTILSKSALKKDRKIKKYISQIDTIVSQIDDTKKLNKLLLKLQKIEIKLEEKTDKKSIQLKNIINYLSGKIELKLLEIEAEKQ